jgi:hypothetical protein
MKNKETLEEAAEKSSLYNEIYSIVKQIPRKETNSDAMDYPSATSSIEELFHKWQQKQDKNLYSLDNLKEAFAMGRTNATIKDFNTKFKNK